jgi:transposase
MYSIGLDVHKRTISYCVKDAAGHVHQEGKIGSTRRELDAWVKALPQPPDDGHGSDDLHRVDLRSPASACGKGEGGASADAAGRSQRPKRKNDKIDAGKIADCLRCDFLPECHMTSTEIREPAPDTALPEPCAEADGSDEEPGIGAADGDRGEL